MRKAILLEITERNGFFSLGLTTYGLLGVDDFRIIDNGL